MMQATQTTIPAANTSANTIVPANGDANEGTRHLRGLIVTTPNAAAATLTLSDGTQTVAVFDYPNAAVAPAAPLVVNVPLPQSKANAAWTLQASANASGYHVTAIWGGPDALK